MLWNVMDEVGLRTTGIYELTCDFKYIDQSIHTIKDIINVHEIYLLLKQPNNQLLPNTQVQVSFTK